MANNINQIIFSRTQPTKKISIIKALTDAEVMNVSTDTISRIVREAGKNRYKSRDKVLYITRGNKAGNDWNSSLESIGICKRRLYVDLYVQYGDCDTDTTVCEDFDIFFRRGEYRGEIKGTDRYGNPRTYYFIYDQDDKVKCMRSILLQYVMTKYASKLQDNG